MKWAQLLRTAAFAYNKIFGHSLRVSPLKAMYGYDLDFHVDITNDTTLPAARDRVKKLHELRETYTVNGFKPRKNKQNIRIKSTCQRN